MAAARNPAANNPIVNPIMVPGGWLFVTIEVVLVTVTATGPLGKMVVVLVNVSVVRWPLMEVTTVERTVLRTADPER
jgi:hypothetical protein